eukprot:scaffold64016_cov21-Prasinocladus_malaysianus.AAC.1
MLTIIQCSNAPTQAAATLTTVNCLKSLMLCGSGSAQGLRGAADAQWRTRNGVLYDSQIRLIPWCLTTSC